MQEAGTWPHNRIFGSPEPAYASDFHFFFGPVDAPTADRTRESHHQERGVPLPTATIPSRATLGHQPLPAPLAAGYRQPLRQPRLSPRPAIRQPTKPPRTGSRAAVPPRRSLPPREVALREPANRIRFESPSFLMKMPTNLKLSPPAFHHHRAPPPSLRPNCLSGLLNARPFSTLGKFDGRQTALMSSCHFRHKRQSPPIPHCSP